MLTQTQVANYRAGGGPFNARNTQPQERMSRSRDPRRAPQPRFPPEYLDLTRKYKNTILFQLLSSTPEPLCISYSFHCFLRPRCCQNYDHLEICIDGLVMRAYAAISDRHSRSRPSLPSASGKKDHRLVAILTHSATVHAYDSYFHTKMDTIF